MVTGESATIHCHLQDEVRRTKDAVRLIMSNRINWGNGTRAQSSKKLVETMGGRWDFWGGVGNSWGCLPTISRQLCV